MSSSCTNCWIYPFIVDFEHIIPPYLHLMLGLTNDVVKEIFKDLTQLGSTDPKKVEAALQRRMKMPELELLIANAVDDLVGQLGSDARDLVSRIVEGMATATEDEDAAASVAAPRAGGRVMVGEVAKADWKELKDFADTCCLEVMRDAEARAQTLRDGTYRSERDQLKNRRPGKVAEDEQKANGIMNKARNEVGALGESWGSLERAKERWRH